MDSYTGNLAADLLDVTGRYLSACNLKSFVMPLPFCDETLLDRRALLAKVLANVSCVAKEQLFGVVQALAAEERRPRGGFENFSHAFDMAVMGKRQIRNPRKVPSQGGIRSTLRPTTTALSEKLMVELSSMHDPTQIAQKLDSAIRSISQPDTVGFVMIIASEKKSVSNSNRGERQLLPVAGGVVEILDPEEHCVRCLWSDPRLVHKEESEFGKILALRILGHLFDYGYPGAATNNKLKHTSVLNVHGVLFPTAVYTFMINGLKFGKHFETQDNGGSHEDSCANFCRCLRLADSADAELFWGISESRLKSTFYNIRAQIPVKPSDQTLETLQLVTQRAG
ncbi:uncharacterized protein BcabD6B2_54080 [Babesia caballi]|uniref:Uncharacterized protein n=1 Tax=Babesia caballi TaxID=5871 RepID=A0AAV4M1M3_BABCB|nr:hypothetical protein BcabD6B2_54080 [Babesia caballi]